MQGEMLCTQMILMPKTLSCMSVGIKRIIFERDVLLKQPVNKPKKKLKQFMAMLETSNSAHNVTENANNLFVNDDDDNVGNHILLKLRKVCYNCDNCVCTYNLT